MKRPPDKKLWLAVAILIVAASAFARPADRVKPLEFTVLGER